MDTPSQPSPDSSAHLYARPIPSNTRIRTILGNYNIFEQVHNPSVVQKALTATGIRSSSSSSSSSSSICSLFVFLFPFTHVFSPLTFNPFQCHCHCSRHVARLLPQVTSPPQSLRKHRPRCFLLRLQLQHLLHTITPFISYFRSNLPWRPEDARHSNNRSHIFKSAPIYQLHPCVILTPVPSIPPIFAIPAYTLTSSTSSTVSLTPTACSPAAACTATFFATASCQAARLKSCSPSPTSASSTTCPCTPASSTTGNSFVLVLPLQICSCRLLNLIFVLLISPARHNSFHCRFERDRVLRQANSAGCTHIVVFAAVIYIYCHCRCCHAAISLDAQR